MSDAEAGSPDVTTGPAVAARHTTGAPRRDPVRTSGILLVIGCCLELVIWEVQRRWGWTPTPIAITETALQAVLGAGLIHSGRRWALPTLVFIAAAALITCVRSALTSAPLFDGPGMAGLVIVVSVPLVMGLLRIAPFLLLLIGQPATFRYRTAIVLFVFQQLIELGVAGLTIYTVELMRHR
jgi:hypothetical protein